jgi:hypothetical protein
MRLLQPFVAEPIQAPAPQVAEESAQEIIALKERFAELYLREPEAFKVAMVLYPNDTGKALRIAHSWPNDPEVKTLMKSLQEASEEFEFHPTKEQFAKKLLNTAEEMLSVDPQTAHKYHDSYRKMRWPDAAVNIQDNRVTNNVMVVRDHGTPDEWEAKTLAQQRKLKEDAVVSTIAKTN